MIFNLEEFKNLVEIDIKNFKDGLTTEQDFVNDRGPLTKKYDDAIEAIDLYESYKSDAHTTWHDGEFNLHNAYTNELFIEFSKSEQEEIIKFINEMQSIGCAYCDMEEIDSVEEFRNAHHTDGIDYKIIDIKKVLKEVSKIILHIELMCDAEYVSFDDI